MSFSVSTPIISLSQHSTMSQQEVTTTPPMTPTWEQEVINYISSMWRETLEDPITTFAICQEVPVTPTTDPITPTTPVIATLTPPTTPPVTLICHEGSYCY